MNNEEMQKRILSVWYNQQKKPEGITDAMFSHPWSAFKALLDAGVYHPTPEQIKASRLTTEAFLDVVEKQTSDYNDVLRTSFIRNHLKWEKVEELRKLSQRLLDDTDTCEDILPLEDQSQLYSGASLVEAYKQEIPAEYREINFGIMRDQLRGLVPGDVVNIAGRSGTGKTALLLLLMDGAWKGSRLKSLFFSVEMKVGQIAKRLHDIGFYARVGEGWEMATLRDECWRSWIDARKRQDFVKYAPEWLILTDRGCHIDQLEQKILGARKKGHQVDIVGIDYLQLLEGSGKDRRTEVAYIARKMKQIAKRCAVIIISLCQTSRAGEDGKKPVQLHHLKESGDIEEASDVIVGLWSGDTDDHVWTHDIKNRSAGSHEPRPLHRCGVYFREPREKEVYVQKFHKHD